VIIGGGISQIGDIITAPIRQAVRERAMRASEQSVRITTGMLGRRSVLIGATVQALNVAIHAATENKNSTSKETILESLEVN
jgi:predicted NBD/HSP70 family sugar kinase